MSYTAKDIRTLTDIESVQINPDQYIGSTERPTHLIEEPLDNALDEAQGGHVKIIAVVLDTKKHIYSIIDDGRGIPTENDVPQLISTKLHSGAKFRDSKTAYEISSGMHGVGLVTLTALSETYTIEIYRDNKHAIFQFVDSKLKQKSIKPFEGKKPFSTKIEFQPSKKYFHNLLPDIERIRRRLTTASAEMNQNISFVLIVDGKKEVIKHDLITHFKELCINNDDELLSDPIQLNSTVKPESFNVIFSYSTTGSIGQRVYSSVNLLPVDSGGTHVNLLFEVLKDFFNTKAKKYGFKFQPQDCLIGLRAYLMLSIREPRFSSQTKERLTCRKEYFDKLIIQLRNGVTSVFENEQMLISHLEKFQEYRERMDSKKMKSTNGKRASTKFTKLRDCTSVNGELFIVEGDSAAGGFISCRDPKKHAIFPLRGKIPNATTAKDILKNKEIGELISALGTGIGPHFDLSKLKYDKIIWTTDADPDGLHINCIGCLNLAILVPEIVKAGKLYFIQTPLYAINEKNVFIPLWTQQELLDAQKNKRNITRFKGLGEYNPSQLKVVTLDEKIRKLIQITYSSNMEKMIKLFSSPEEKRELILNPEYTIC